MSPLLKSRASEVTAEQLTTRSGQLAEALDQGGAQLDPELAARARAVLDKVGERTAHGGNATIVALAGATGSGKSSLFNAIVGAQVATIGARRPTTSLPTAAIWGPEDAAQVLDWLQVGSRHRVRDDSTDRLDGLVLLDLPDFDSREVANRAEAERVLDLVDVFIWVTDPQKYADARLHDDYVAAMTQYDAVTIVVLNQADRLTPAGLAACTADLKRLLTTDGLANAQVIATSAQTGQGVDDLRARLAKAVEGARAARVRLDADVRTAARALVPSLGAREVEVDAAAVRQLVDALSGAAGVPTVVDAVRRDYKRDAIAETGWPFTRWVTKLRPNPLRRLHLDGDREAGAITSADIRRSVGRSSLPVATPTARAAVDLASHRLSDKVGAQLPHRWQDAIADAARPGRDALADELDQAIMRTSLRARRPLWWSVLHWLQFVLAITAGVGLLWLALIAILGYFQFDVPTPSVGPFAVPFLLGIGGLVLGWLVALSSRWFASIGAGRRAASVGRRLRAAIADVADRVIVTPVNAIVTRHAKTRRALDSAAG